MDYATVDPMDVSTTLEDDDEQDFGEVMPPCIIAFDYHNKTLGVAYYKSETRDLYMSADLHEVSPFNQWQTAGLQIEPNHVLISSRANDALFEAKGHTVVLRRPEIRPRAEFSHKPVLSRLTSIFRQVVVRQNDIENQVPDLKSRQETETQLQGVLDFDAILSLGCINALLNFIQNQRQFSNQPKDDFLLSMVTSIEMFSLPETMLMNADTFYSLKIFEPRLGKKVASQGKELDKHRSLFALLDSCSTRPGKALLKHWFLTPSTDLEVLNARYDAIECFMLPGNIHLSEKIVKTLRRCHDMQHAVNLLQRGLYGSSSGSVWQSILSFSLNTIKLTVLIKDLSDATAIPVIARIDEQRVIAHLEVVSSLINDVIDFDESEVEGRIVVKRLVDDLLDERKDAFEGIDLTLNKAEIQVAAEVPPDFAESVRCLYIPQLGFHIVMPIQESKGMNGDAVQPPIYQHENWAPKFCSTEQWYFKNHRMAELDEYFGDLHSLVVDREIELLHQLQLRVLDHSDVLTETSDNLAELDCLLSLTSAARKYSYCRPEMTTENVLQVRGGRHPLLEHMIDIFVPNDLSCRGYSPDDMAEETLIEPNAIVMTGANYSGKSIYLKQAALIVYMAHIGSFVPALSATIGVTDRILTRLQSRDTIAKAQSAFLTDLQQVSYALNMLTPRSLLVIDEFGKATEEIAGPSLFAALLWFLTEPSRMRPRALLTTHFHEVIREKYLPPNTDAYILKHMQIVIDDTKEDLGDQITYLFKVADGPSYSSFGINCAALAGMPKHILKRAQEFVEIQARGESLVDALAVPSADEDDDMADAEALARRFLEWDIEAEPDKNQKAKLKESVHANVKEPILCAHTHTNQSEADYNGIEG